MGEGGGGGGQNLFYVVTTLALSSAVVVRPGHHRVSSEARPASVQPMREAKFLTVIELTTMHAVCRITFMLYPIFTYRRMILQK